MKLRVGRMMSKEFYWADHYDYEDVHRGPFTTSYAWIESIRQLVKIDCSNLDAGGEPIYANDARKIIKRLANKLKVLFHVSGPTESSVVTNCDLSTRNILVKDNELAGVVGWENCVALPRWAACEVPEFLQGRTRHEEPDEKDYDERDHEEYDSHVMEWIRTKARGVFLGEMAGLAPEWIATYQHGMTILRKDFMRAARMCHDREKQGAINSWLDDFETFQHNRYEQHPQGRDTSLEELGYTIRSLRDHLYDPDNLSTGVGPQLT
ncbi:Uu.00g135570.m01.CDS01 [Anthostomella pinea]|uniref:Uu.00g135570.m01.CDS01 n=1 Tax=Anthostomella pinea TaxID=933095 RepID=A0AAI8VQC1_9PEZI|nr:Uu.00g135570.m01.CDS01 [Anthostomella pinea]